MLQFVLFYFIFFQPGDRNTSSTGPDMTSTQPAASLPTQSTAQSNASADMYRRRVVYIVSDSMLLGIAVAKPENRTFIGNPKKGGNTCRPTEFHWSLASHLDIYQVAISGLAAKFGGILYTPAQIANLFNNLQAPPPDLVVFWLGMNDCAGAYHQNNKRHVKVHDIYDEVLAYMSAVSEAIKPDTKTVWLGPGSATNVNPNQGSLDFNNRVYSHPELWLRQPRPKNPNVDHRGQSKFCPYSKIVNRLNTLAEQRSKHRDGFLDMRFHNIFFKKICHIHTEDIKDKFNHPGERVRKLLATHLMKIVDGMLQSPN